MNSPVSYMGNDPIRDQLIEMRAKARAAALQKDEREEDYDDDEIII